jgi:hypothetical protein
LLDALKNLVVSIARIECLILKNDT